MREALESVGEFLSRYGALEGANAVVDMLHKLGVQLPESSPLRWRALLAAIRQELDAEPMDVVFLFERLLQLDAAMVNEPSHALFGSPLFLHLVVQRFAQAFEGLDAELFKLESDELCHAEGIYETCVLIRDKIEANRPESELTKFLAGFVKIFEQDEPKECWDAFYEMYRLEDVCFRRDMKRALCQIEETTLGPTKIELAFPTKQQAGSKKIVPRALLEKRYGGTRQEWRDLSEVNSITGADHIRAANAEREQEQQPQTAGGGDTVVEPQFAESTGPFEAAGPSEATEPSERTGPSESAGASEPTGTSESAEWVWSTRVPFPLDGEATASSISEDLDEPVVAEPPASSRPPRAATTARAARQEMRRLVQHPTPTENVDTANNEASPAMSSRRRPRRRWSEEEEAALLEGHRLFGSYKNVWMLIKTRFADVLQTRSNVDLKDKYRNMLKYGKIPQPGADSVPSTADATTNA